MQIHHTSSKRFNHDEASLLDNEANAILYMQLFLIELHLNLMQLN